jgi:hypothetical protein
MRTYFACHQERSSGSDYGQQGRFRNDFRLIPEVVKYGVTAPLMTDENE